MADQIEEIKQKIDIVDIIGKAINLKKAGRNYKANCPFHQEKSPSFMVSPELQMYKCFGCGESGDVFTFLQKQEGMEFVEALNFLADKAGVKLESGEFKKTGEKEKFLELNNQVKYFYTYMLLKHPSGKEALDYLKVNRGLSLETIKAFGLGFSPNVPLALKSFMIDKKGYKSVDLQKAGITVNVRGSVFDRFRGRIIFPISDHLGKTIAFSGRILPGPNEKKFAKYINSPETLTYSKSRSLYGIHITKEAIKQSGAAVIVEGELDLLSPWQAGCKNIVAIKGSAFTADQANIIGRFAKRVIFMLDSDQAGTEAVRRGISVAEKAGLEVLVAEPTKYKDPDEIARNEPELLQEIIKNPINAWDFIFESIFKKYDTNSSSGKLKISREIVPILSDIGDSIVRAHFVAKLADKLAIPEESIYEMLKASKGEGGAEASKVKPVIQFDPAETRRDLLEERFLLLCLAYNPKKLNDEQEEIKKIFENKKVLSLLDSFYALKSADFDLREFAQSLTLDSKTYFENMFLNIGEENINENLVEKEIDQILIEIQIEKLNFEMEEIPDKIRMYERKKEKKRVKKLQKEFIEKAAKIAELKKEL